MVAIRESAKISVKRASFNSGYCTVSVTIYPAS